MDMIFLISMVDLVGIDVYIVKFIMMKFQIILFICFKKKYLLSISTSKYTAILVLFIPDN